MNVPMLMHRSPKGNCKADLHPDGSPQRAFRQAGSDVNLASQSHIRGLTAQEDVMAKGQQRSNKEKKKPKADTDKVKQVSAYKAAQGAKK